MKTVLALVAILATTAVADGAPRAPAKQNERNPLIDVRVDIERCAYQVFVNGGSVAESKSPSPTHESAPANHFLRSGENELALFLFIQDEPACDAKLTVGVSDAHNPDGKPTTLLTLAYSSSQKAGKETSASTPAGLDAGPVQTKVVPRNGFKILMVSRKFSAKLPFPEWAFFRGEKMPQGWEFPSSDQMTPAHDEIQRAYVALHDLLAKKDVNGFLDACEERSREIDLAYYKAKGATRARLKQELEAALNDPQYKLEPAVKAGGKRWTYNVGSTGRLIALTTGPRGSAILRFASPTNPLDLVFPVSFRKEGSRFIVTR
jgi:hypothetical protein